MLARVWRRDELRQIMIVVGGFETYEGLRHFITPDWSAALRHAYDIERLERWGHFAWEQSLQRAFLGMPHVVQAMNLFYFAGHFLLTGVFFAWLYFRSRDGFRSFRNGFLIATAVSLFIHWKFPTAPPRLADIGLEDTLRAFSGIDIGSPQSSSYSNPVAAVPSLHAGWAVAVAYGIVKFGRAKWAKALAVLYPAAVVLTIVVTGNHFIFDAITGILVMMLGFMLSARLSGARTGATMSPATRGGAVR